MKTDAEIIELMNMIKPFFNVYDVKRVNDDIVFYGMPLEYEGNIYRDVIGVLFTKGYTVSIKYELGEYVVIISRLKHHKEKIWINIVLAIATIFTTMMMGSIMFGTDPFSNPFEIYKGLPFTIAIMGVLGSHEAGHYLIAKRYNIDTSLPYFIPFPSLIGTMGAVIKQRGQIPNRKALFDVGISGPLIGLFISIITVIIGLLLPPVDVNGSNLKMILSLPPLFELITKFIPFSEDAPLHPVAFAGWVGMLVTALNLIPSGQLDGGHVLRAMLGEKAALVSKAMPYIVFLIGIYVNFIKGEEASMWFFWGILLLFFSAAGHPTPLNDEIKIGKKRMIIGIITFILGLMCVTLVPIKIM